MNMRRTCPVATPLIAWVSLLGIAQAGTLTVYHTTDEAEKDSQPSEQNEWDEVGENNLITGITLAKGDKFWVCCKNENADAKIKAFEMAIADSGEGTTKSKLKLMSVEGFRTGNESSPVAAEKVKQRAGDTSTKYSFKPQPVWERLEFEATEAIAGGTLKVRAWSYCSQTKRKAINFPTLVLQEGTFGAVGAVIGEPQIVRISIFPRTQPVDPNVAPTFEAPPQTGNWTATFVDVDPRGDERPLGGVSFTTDGPGLSTGDTHDLSLAMLGGVDMYYDMFAFESTREEYLDFVIAAGQTGLREDFDTYPVGEEICGHGLWEEWDGSEGVCGHVTDAESFDGGQSLEIVGAEGPAGDDVVQPFDIVGGVWDFKAQVFVPDDATGQAFVILLNQYPPEELNNWSLQIVYDARDHVLFNFNDPTQSTPMVTGVWTDLSAHIDLDNDVVEVTYGGDTFVTDRSWRDGVAPGGEPWIQALDLYAGEPDDGGISEIFFDDVSLIEFHEVLGACCVEEEGFCEDLVLREDCAERLGRFSEDTMCADLDPPCGEHGGCIRDPQWQCDGDVDGDGQVNPVDSGLVQSKFGSTSDQDLCNFDIDCDGQINPVDAGIVQSLFGTCEPPRAECP